MIRANSVETEVAAYLADNGHSLAYLADNSHSLVMLQKCPAGKAMFVHYNTTLLFSVSVKILQNWKLDRDCTAQQTPALIDSTLSRCFNGHFAGEPGLAGVY